MYLERDARYFFLANVTHTLAVSVSVHSSFASKVCSSITGFDNFIFVLFYSSCEIFAREGGRIIPRSQKIFLSITFVQAASEVPNNLGPYRDCVT